MASPATPADVVGRETSGAEAAIDALVAGGVDAVFGIPGGHNLDLYDAIAGQPSIRSFVPRHEQGAGFMADGYARASGKSGVCVLIEGPGSTNALTALGEARADHSPLLVVTSQIRSDLIDREVGALHELRRHLEVVSSACSWNARATDVGMVQTLIHRAFATHASGVSAPVHVEIPLDVLASRADLGAAPAAVAAAASDPDLDRAIDLINKGPNPVIYAGGGINRAGCWESVGALADATGAPVLTTALGKGAIAENDPHYVGTLSLWSPWVMQGPVADLIAGADPLIVLGARLSDASTCDWRMPRPRTLVHFDIDPTAFASPYPADVQVAGELRATLARLLPSIKVARRGPSGPTVESARRHIADHASSVLGDGLHLLGAVSDVLGPETVLMGDSLIGLWAASAWRTDRPRSYHVPMHFNTLGFAMPAAMGARVARPDVPIVALAGEGAFMFTMAELSTAVQHELPIIVIVANDHSYTSIRRQQVARFDRTIGVDLQVPDLPRLAESMGALGLRASDPRDVRRCLEIAVAASRPALIEVELSVAAPWDSVA